MKTNKVMSLGLKLSLVALAFTSCQKKLEELAGSSSLAPAPAATMDGIWSTDCMPDSSDSYIKSIEVKDGVMTIAILQYSETRFCEQAKLISTFMQSGPLTVIADNVSIVRGKNYEWRLDALIGVPNDASLTAMLNNGFACGNNNWVTNEPGILFACTVGAGFDLSNVAYQTVHHGVYVLESSVTPNYLQFETKCELNGYENFCPSSGDRPGTVSGDVYFRR